MVDGVLASCHASVDHDLAHFTMTPVQWIPEVVEWIFGEETGFPVFVSVIRKLGKLMLPYGQYFS